MSFNRKSYEQLQRTAGRTAQSAFSVERNRMSHIVLMTDFIRPVVTINSDELILIFELGHPVLESM